MVIPSDGERGPDGPSDQVSEVPHRHPSLPGVTLVAFRIRAPRGSGRHRSGPTDAGLVPTRIAQSISRTRCCRISHSAISEGPIGSRSHRRTGISAGRRIGGSRGHPGGAHGSARCCWCPPRPTGLCLGSSRHRPWMPPSVLLVRDCDGHSATATPCERMSGGRGASATSGPDRTRSCSRRIRALRREGGRPGRVRSGCPRRERAPSSAGRRSRPGRPRPSHRASRGADDRRR